MVVDARRRRPSTAARPRDALRVGDDGGARGAYRRRSARRSARATYSWMCHTTAADRGATRAPRTWSLKPLVWMTSGRDRASRTPSRGGSRRRAPRGERDAASTHDPPPGRLAEPRQPRRQRQHVRRAAARAHGRKRTLTRHDDVEPPRRRHAGAARARARADSPPSLPSPPTRSGSAHAGTGDPRSRCCPRARAARARRPRPGSATRSAAGAPAAVNVTARSRRPHSVMIRRRSISRSAVRCAGY